MPDATPPPTAEQRFALNMKVLREALGWNQTELARRLTEAGVDGFHQTTISRIEKGDRPVRLGEATAIAGVLRVPVEQMTADGAGLGVLAEIRSGLAGVRAAERLLFRAASDFDDAVRRLRAAVGDPDPWADGNGAHSPWKVGPEDTAVTMPDVGFPGEAADALTRRARSMLSPGEKESLHIYLTRHAGDVMHEYEHPGVF